MSDQDSHIYRVVEIVGSSETSIEDAVHAAIRRADETLRNVRWFEILETRGDVAGGRAAHFQVRLNVGFTLDT